METQLHSTAAMACKARALTLLLAFLAFAALPGVRAAQTDLAGPPGSGLFGVTVTLLPNGNFVVTDQGYDAPGPIPDVGAVYLYDGVTLAVISTLNGSTANDRVGIGVTVLSNGNYVVSSPGAVTWGNGTTGVTGVVSAANSLVGGGSVTALNNGNYVVSSPGAVTWGNGATGVTGVVSAANSLVGGGSVTALNNGNYVVRNPFWNNDGAINAGAVTWGSGTTGVTGVVSAANSLVGSTAGDVIGSEPGSFSGLRSAVIALDNGNYVVRSPFWDNDGVTDAGAVTWGSGTTGVTGVVSQANSLVGSTAGDQIGFDPLSQVGSVTFLNNGNYVVRSKAWDNGMATNVGAVTWGSGTTGVTGVVSAANSLVGTTADDAVGLIVTALNNGNYVVTSPYWNNGAVFDAGAVTWGNGTTGVTGAISAANSLVGSRGGDQIGFDGFYGYCVIPLNNGNYVVRSPFWNNGTIADAGSVTWGNGTTGVKGVVSAANSLVGSMANDQVGSVQFGDNGVTALNNGNYVVRSPAWNKGAVADAGAVTWGSGTSGVKGVVSAANSLVGSAANDQVGSTGVTLLNNGSYVVSSPLWNNGAVADAGALTWGSGTTGVTGAVSVANSLVCSKANDLDSSLVTALNNGNYVVTSPSWDNGSATNAGAVTWGSGTNGVSGVISAANSLVGSTAFDQVGYDWLNGFSVTALNNGNYVVRSSSWDNGAATDAGAVTWGSGTTGVSGTVTAANSLVGSTASDQVGGNGVFLLNDGSYVVRSPAWDNGAAIDAGAVTLGDGTFGTSGTVSAANSVLGMVAFGGSLLSIAYDLPNIRLLVGDPRGNRVSLFRYTPFLSIALDPGGVRLRFTGVPGHSYTIESAPAVTGPWSTHATPTSPPSGLIEYLDTNAPAGSAFYRTVQP